MTKQFVFQCHHKLHKDEQRALLKSFFYFCICFHLQKKSLGIFDELINDVRIKTKCHEQLNNVKDTLRPNAKSIFSKLSIPKPRWHLCQCNCNNDNIENVIKTDLQLEFGYMCQIPQRTIQLLCTTQQLQTRTSNVFFSVKQTQQSFQNENRRSMHLRAYLGSLHLCGFEDEESVC